MSDQSLLVRLPESVHAQLKKAAAEHKPSMQKVVAALVEGWIDSGSPHPVQCRISDDSNSDVVDSCAVDKMGLEKASMRWMRRYKHLDNSYLCSTKGLNPQHLDH